MKYIKIREICTKRKIREIRKNMYNIHKSCKNGARKILEIRILRISRILQNTENM